jgi:predicted nucleic acid-binding Zn ribbon protein
VSLGRQAPRPLSLALETFTAGVAPASTLARVQACWEMTVGPAIAAAAAPLAERDGVLTVRCEAAVWSQELELMAVDLLDRLNAALDEELLHKLRCRVG